KKTKSAPPKPGPSTIPLPVTSKEEAEIKAALAKLSEQDRRLAEGQKFCPMTDKPLGSMDVPVKLMLKGLPVFLCCEGCVDQAKVDETRTLTKVSELKAKVTAGSSKQ